jgi:HAD superfamily hydrolase (TIGR01450 family)
MTSPLSAADTRSVPAIHLAVETIRNAKGILLDWDGSVAIGNRMLPAARRLIEMLGARVVILSNNSTHLPEEIARLLEREGISIAPERILLAGVETVRWVAGQGHKRVLLLGSPALAALARSLGLEVSREAKDIVLLMRDARFTYIKLARATAALADGALLVVANADRTHPGPAGQLVPETGALLAALSTCQPDVEPFIVGKPGPLLFEKACRLLGVTPGEAVMIGDNPETDGAGAAALGMQSILIGGANGFRLEDLVEALGLEE